MTASTIVWGGGIVIMAFLIGKYELHTTIPEHLLSGLWHMEYKNMVIGSLVGVACVYCAILVPLYAIAEDESR